MMTMWEAARMRRVQGGDVDDGQGRCAVMNTTVKSDFETLSTVWKVFRAVLAREEPVEGGGVFDDVSAVSQVYVGEVDEVGGEFAGVASDGGPVGVGGVVDVLEGWRG